MQIGDQGDPGPAIDGDATQSGQIQLRRRRPDADQRVSARPGTRYTRPSIGNLSDGWDDNKNKTSEGITGTMSGYGFDVGMTGYDDEDRLVNWQRDDTNLDQSWDLALVGDWDSVTENANTCSRYCPRDHLTGQSIDHA